MNDIQTQLDELRKDVQALQMRQGALRNALTEIDELESDMRSHATKIRAHIKEALQYV